MGAPLADGMRGPDDSRGDAEALVRVFEDMLDAAGDISLEEARLLTAIARRLERLAHSHGRRAALEAAERARRIWLQAIEDDEDLGVWFGLRGTGM